MTTRITRTDGQACNIVRDVAHQHPQWVHDQLGTSSEVELQRSLDQMTVEDWYNGDEHLGPDACGLEMFRERQKISIVADNVWAGDGWLREGVIEDCPAILGGSQDAADNVYETIEEAIAAGEDEITVDGVRYAWTISEA